MNTNDVIIRLESKEDRRAVETLVRDAFWNVYRPGCSEHYVLHVLRDDPAFVRSLDLVMELDGRLIGQAAFMRAAVTLDGGGIREVLTLGPICVAPDLQRRGYGRLLLEQALDRAAAQGFGAVLLEGNIGFYGKSRFTFAGAHGVRYHGLPEGADASFFLCRELIPGYLAGITGVYRTPQGYFVGDADVEAFDEQFPPREKLRLPGQLF